MDNKIIVKWILITLLLVVFVVVYRLYNPTENLFFLKCPFLMATGLKCPGCGSQRTLHHLLNFDFVSAIKENAVLIMAIPYVAIGFVFDFLNKSEKTILKWRNRSFGRVTVYITLILPLIIAFAYWIIRNIVEF